MSPSPLHDSDAMSQLESNLLLAQYQSLRSEIVGIVTARYQTVQITIIALGAAVAAAVQFSNPLIAMAYPVLAYILASTWATDERSIRRIAAYIADHIEFPLSLQHGVSHPDHYTLDWETYMRSLRKAAKRRSPFTASLGLFSMSELTALLAGVFIAANGTHSILNLGIIQWLGANIFNGNDALFTGFFIVDVLCVLATLISMASVSDAHLDK